LCALQRPRPHRAPPSFPTRRSSDLWQFHFLSHARSGGNWTFNGQATGLGLADLLMGRVGRLEHGGPAILPMDQWYAGLYAQDARSEEHTSELQSLRHLVCRLLLEKK